MSTIFASPIMRLTMGFILSVFSFVGLVNAQDESLSLKHALQLAHQFDDPSVGQYLAQAKSQQAMAIADAQLPDPKIKFGIANLATNSFRFNQEPMTQMQFGVHQSFISAEKRRLLLARGRAGSKALLMMASSRKLNIEFEVKRLWLSLRHSETVSKIIKQKKVSLNEMLDALGAKFESGMASAQKILIMEAELALFDDKIESIDQTILRLRVELSRYIGTENALLPIMGSFDDLENSQALTMIEEGLNAHPEILKEKALISAGDKAELLAKENYKPNWGVDFGYGVRAGGRADMATAMVTLDVPLFRGNRQDKRLLAAKQSKQAAILKLQAKKMDMLRNVRAAHVVWLKSYKRISLYNTVILERTKSATTATEYAYANGNTDFAEIIRAHISELDARVKMEGIKLERAISQATLSYYQGEAS
jgi:outer membrane protein TolC